MKNFSKLLLLILITAGFSSIGWNNFGTELNMNTITDFYYYKGQPFKLTLKPDMVFIRLNKELTENEFKTIISPFGNVLLNSPDYIPGDKRYFVNLSFAKEEAGLLEVISRLNLNPDIQYASPVFSPDNGKTLIGMEDEIIVQFKPSTAINTINSYFSNKNMSIVKDMELSGGASYLVRIPQNVSSIDAANELYASGLTNWAEPNLMFTNLFCFDPNDPFYSQQWAEKNLGNNIPGGITGTADCDMDVDSAWNSTLGNANCKIAVSDTGVDTLHEDLAGNMVVGSGYDFWNNDPYAWDDGNHGTACSGIIAAIGNNNIGVSGVAPNCKLIPVKWLSNSGNGNYAGATSATIWSYQKGAWVISNSWGFVGGASSALDAAILDAVTLGRSGKGSIFVVASGNENGAMRFPASTNPNVLVVGGISPCNQRKSPSSCDLENFWGASYGANLDLVAPCVKIYTTDRTGSVGYSTGNYFATFNGTSSATPNTAGVCALAFSMDSTMRWDTLRSRIDRTCEKRGSYSYTSPGPRNLGQWNNEMGYGLVNARLLLASLAPPLANDVSTGPYLSFPATFKVGTAYNVRSLVTNAGTSGQTNIPMKFFINGVQTGSTINIASLLAGASDSVTYSWTPSVIGPHTLKIAHGLAVDGNRNNDTVTAVIDVLPTGIVNSVTSICRNGLNKPILDLQTTRDTINVNIPNSFNVIDVNVKIDTVDHSYDGDLQFTVTHIAASSMIVNQVGGSNDNFRGTILNDSAATPIASGVAPFTGSFIPSNPLSVFNGTVVNGPWVLNIFDAANQDQGSLKAWCLIITYQTILGGIQSIEIPNYFSLSQNYPNPFNPSTTIKFSLPKAELVTLKVYDVLGKEVAVLVNEMKEPGFYNVDFNGSNMASGIYFYRIEAGEFSAVKKLMLIK
ncbi:MAG: S8 family serine peptidase [Ignavibacteria bacterium]|nr:S8 family serine peptidase [Ignavibacteria bacterium]